MQLETTKGSQMTKDTSNLDKLRALVDVLETQNQEEPQYTKTISTIEKVLKDELKVINKLTRKDVKLKHYEVICSSILALVTSTS